MQIQSSNRTFRLADFFSDFRRFWSSRFRFAALDGLTGFRFLGAEAIARISWRSFSSTSEIFRGWSRYRWLVRISVPSRLIRFPYRARNRCLTGNGNDEVARTSHRRVTFEFTLFTFWPPGPGERENDICSSERGMTIESLTRSI